MMILKAALFLALVVVAASQAYLDVVVRDELETRKSTWPKGTYGLPQSAAGCADKWETGVMNLHTESLAPSKNTVSDPTALVQPLFTKDGTNNFANFHFCMKTADAAVGPDWQAGSYCIYKKGDCPSGFHDGNIFIDAQDENEANKFSGSRPDGVYGHNVQLDFCCRKDGPACVDITLPTLKPFYLFRFGGKCQRVKDMVVREEFVVVDTDNTTPSIANIDKYSNEFHPDGKLNDVRIELCYYDKPCSGQ